MKKQQSFSIVISSAGCTRDALVSPNFSHDDTVKPASMPGNCRSWCAPSRHTAAAIGRPPANEAA